MVRPQHPAVALVLLLVWAVLTAEPATAQVAMQPTPPPIVDASNERWYQRGEPVPFAGELYYPGGPAVFFDGNRMVRTGHHDGVPLYADTTIEPYSIVYVPIGRGLMQPYERPRRGELAGTTGSRTPSFPVGATPGPMPTVGVEVPAAAATRGIVVTPPAPQPSGPVETLREPESNDGIWVRFAGEKWVSEGPAVPLSPGEFVVVGEHAGFPVFARRALDEEVIYLPMRADLVAPYRLKE